MTDLTEQWKKGELPSGWYWVKGVRAEGIYAYTSEYLNNIDRPADGEKIVEKVPSYEQWQQLKELLKQSRIYVLIDTEDYEVRIVSKSDREAAKKLLAQINQALGEK